MRVETCPACATGRRPVGERCPACGSVDLARSDAKWPPRTASERTPQAPIICAEAELQQESPFTGGDTWSKWIAAACAVLTGLAVGLAVLIVGALYYRPKRETASGAAPNVSIHVATAGVPAAPVPPAPELPPAEPVSQAPLIPIPTPTPSRHEGSSTVLAPPIAQPLSLPDLVARVEKSVIRVERGHQRE